MAKQKIFSDMLLHDLKEWKWRECPRCHEYYMGDSATSTKDGKEICASCAYNERSKNG